VPSQSTDNKKEILSWAMYDWANSAFATSVMAGFFPVFFKKYWCAGLDITQSTALLGFSNSIAGIFIGILAPLLGIVSDIKARKKGFLGVFASLGILMTGIMYLIPSGEWMIAALIYIIASIGFAGGNIFYDSLIVGIASKKRLDVVSGLGYAMGYAGGGLLFAVNVWMVIAPETFGLHTQEMAIRLSFLSVSLWWAFFSIPLFLYVREPVKGQTAHNTLRDGFRELIFTLRQIRSLKPVLIFLIAYYLYIDGVDTIVRMALDYGLSIGLRVNDLITALLITQFIGFPSALGFGYLGRRLGTKTGIFIAIGVYLIVSVWGAFIDTKEEFYALAIIVGMVQGGIQALSRSFYARIIPESRSAEFFGFYNLMGKFAAVIGPGLIGTVAILFRTIGFESEISSRMSIASISLLFIAGGATLSFVNEQRARAQASHFEKQIIQ